MKAKLLVVLGITFLGACQNQVTVPNTSNQIPQDQNQKTPQQDDQQSDSSLIAFEQTLEPLLLNHCEHCHGSSQSPLFALAGDSEANRSLLINNNLVNLELDSNPSSSRIVAKVFNGHNCWSSNCTNDGNQLFQQIQNWVQTEDALINQGSEDQDSNQDQDPYADYPQTRSFQIPSIDILPYTNSNDSPIIMRLPLSGAFDGSTSGMYFQIELTLFDDNTYEFSNPKIRTNQRIWVKRPILMINEIPVQDFGNFSWIDQALNSNSNYQDLPTLGSILVPLQTLISNADGSANVFSFAFEVLRRD